MSVATKAIETTGTIDANRQLVLDDPLPITGPKRVRVLILVPDETGIDEAEWFRAAATSPAFDFLKDPSEDMYTVLDGKPFHDPGFGRFPDHGIAQVVNTLSAPHADDLGLSDSARVGRNIAANAG